MERDRKIQRIGEWYPSGNSNSYPHSDGSHGTGGDPDISDSHTIPDNHGWDRDNHRHDYRKPAKPDKPKPKKNKKDRDDRKERYYSNGRKV